MAGCGDAKTELASTCEPPTTTTEVPQAELERKLPQYHELESDMKVVYEYGQGHPADYVDRQWDPDTEPVSILTGFVRNVDEHRAALHKLVAHPGRVQVIAAKHSREELDRVLADVNTEASRGPGTYYSVGSGGLRQPVSTHLVADQEPLAGELHRKYGDALEITLGVRPYPAPACIADTCQPLPPETPMDGLEIRFKEPVTITAGKDGEATVIVRNTGSEPKSMGLDFGPATVVERGTAHVVAAPLQAALVGPATWGPLGPGEQLEMPVSFGTANCGDTGDYALAPGTYGLLVLHGHGTTAPAFMYSNEGTLTVR